MTTLRDKIVNLKRTQYSPLYVNIGDVLDLIPEGAVLVTEASLAAVINDLDCIMGNGTSADNPMLGLDFGTAEEWAAAILARISESS